MQQQQRHQQHQQQQPKQQQRQQQQQQQGEQQGEQQQEAPGFSDVLFAEAARSVELYEDEPGRFKGCLSWRGLGAVLSRLQAAPPDGSFCLAEQTALRTHGAALWLTYACPVPVSGRNNTLSWSPACVLRLRPGQPLACALLAAGGAYEPPEAPAARCGGEGTATERRRWCDAAQQQ